MIKNIELEKGAYQFDAKMPLRQAIPLGLQHVFAMFVGNLTPLLIITSACPNNKLQMLLRGQNLLGYKHYHDDVVEKFIELSIKNGIDVIRIFDALNDFRNLETALNATMKYATKNTIASGCISYTQSPVRAKLRSAIISAS